MGIVIAILMFGFIVFIHELGHFTLAKVNGIRVDEFSLGLGPTIVGKYIKGTKFSLKLLPFGGACMMGEDETIDNDPTSFNGKNVWRRISVILAGPVFNFILALIMCIIMIGMNGYVPPVVGELSPGFSAEEQGMEPGDVITHLNGRRIHLWQEIGLANMINPDGAPIEVRFERDGVSHQVMLEPRPLEGEEGQPLILGISPAEVIQPGVLGTIQYGGYTVRYWLAFTFDSLRLLVSGQVGLGELSGPVGIVGAVDDTFQASRVHGIRTIVMSMMTIGVLLTANLGIMNLLPLPALDGGRLIFLFIEAIRGKRLPAEKEGIVHFIGFALLMVLMVIVLFNDIGRLIGIGG